jgi:hypothetical protein
VRAVAWHRSAKLEKAELLRHTNCDRGQLGREDWQVKSIRGPLKASSFSPSDHLDTSYMYNWDLVSTVYKASPASTTAAFRGKIQMRNEIQQH